jgi:hypothetical protein
MTPAILRAQCAHGARTDARLNFRLRHLVPSSPDTSTCTDEASGSSRALGRQAVQHTANAVWE